MIIDETIRVATSKGKITRIETIAAIIEIGFNTSRKRDYVVIKPKTGQKILASRSYERAVLKPGERILFF